MPPSARKSATTSPKRPSRARDSVSAKRPRGAQRERLLDAMIELSARVGYQQVSIAQVSSKAGVSSATFYEQFQDKEDCFAAAYWATARRVVGELQIQALDRWPDAAEAPLRAFFGRCTQSRRRAACCSSSRVRPGRACAASASGHWTDSSDP